MNTIKEFTNKEYPQSKNLMSHLMHIIQFETKELRSFYSNNENSITLSHATRNLKTLWEIDYTW